MKTTDELKKAFLSALEKDIEESRPLKDFVFRIDCCFDLIVDAAKEEGRKEERERIVEKYGDYSTPNFIQDESLEDAIRFEEQNNLKYND